MSKNKILLDKLSEINQALKYETNEQLGVLSGMSGRALFQFYYSKFLEIDEHAGIGTDILSRCIENINQGNIYPTFCTGLAGMGWTFYHLKKEGLIDLDDELLIELDSYLYTVMVTNIKNGNYDFLHGAIGYGFYFLMRYKTTKSEKLKTEYKEYLIKLIDFLNQLSEREGNKTKWLSVLDIETGKKGYNLSLSHGISSIVNFLSRLYIYDDFQVKVEGMLKRGINYILSFKNENENSLSLFPSYIKKDEAIEWNSRVAWCYGDLGIGLSLWHSAKALKDNSIKNAAIQILEHSALRKTKENTMVMDAGLCHGSFGNAQIFNYMYRQTKYKVFKDAADFWINDGLGKAIHKDGYAGFRMWTKDGWKNELSVLEGIAGIGLAIISYLSEEETNWDECLMIS